MIDNKDSTTKTFTASVVPGLGCGVLLFVLLQLIQWWIFIRPYGGSIPFGFHWEGEPLLVSLLTFLFYVKYVAPPFISGFISHRYAVITGAATVFIGSVLAILIIYFLETILDFFIYTDVLTYIIHWGAAINIFYILAAGMFFGFFGGIVRTLLQR